MPKRIIREKYGDRKTCHGIRENTMIWIPEYLDKIYPYTAPPQERSAAAHKFEANQGDVGGVGRAIHKKQLQTELSGARHEYCSFQLGMNLKHGGKAQIIIPDLRTEDKKYFSKENIKIYRVGYVPLDEIMAPDPLFEEIASEMEPGISTAFRVTVYIPKDQAAGIYQGKIKIKTDEGNEDLILLLRVFNFQLPDNLSMGVNFWAFPEDYARQYRCELWGDRYWELVKSYAGDLKAHGQSIISLLDISSSNSLKLVNWQIDEKGDLNFDFNLFDQWVQVHKEAGIDKGMELSGIARTDFHLFDKKRKKRLLHKFPIGSEKYNRYWGQMLTALSGHLRMKGWMKGVMLKPSDEISEEFVPQWQAIAKLTRKCDKNFLTTEALGYGRKGLIGYCDVFAMHAWLGMDSDYILQAKESGDEVWWYFSCDCDNPNFFIKNDWIEARAIPWLTWHYQLNGVLRWSYSYWNKKNPFEDVYCGKQWPAGDCYMVYPGSDGPVPSVRWEVFREGVQDYEYLKIFHELIQEIPVKEREEIKKLANQYIRRVTGIVTYSRDYANYYAAHNFLGEKIEALNCEQKN